MGENVDVSKMTSEEYAKYLESNGAENAEGGSENNSILDNEIIDGLSQYDPSIQELLKSEEVKSLGKKEVVSKALENIVNKARKSVVTGDPFIDEYLKLKQEENFSFDDFIKSKAAKKSIDEMDNEEYTRYRLKQDGYDDESIDSFIEKKTKIEIDEWAKAKKAEEYNKILEANKANIQKQIKAVSEQNEKANEIIESNITKYLGEGLEKNFPIKFEQDQIDEIIKESKNLLELKVVKGEDGTYYNTQEINSVLANEETLFQILPFIVLAKQGKLDSTIREYFNGIKDSEFRKIDNQPGIGTGGGRKLGINWDKFKNS